MEKVKSTKFEDDYRNLLHKILSKGSLEKNRTGVDCYTLPLQKLQFNAGSGFIPIITGKKIFFDKAYHEFIWLKEGLTTINYLNKNNIYWWDQYANPNGELGKTYGYQLRNYNGEFDQLDYVCRQLKEKTRRAHITLWNPSELNETALPCCYTGFTFVVTGNGKILNMSMQFRSSDVFLGLPYDILVGWLFMKAVAKFSELKLGLISFDLTNAHVYKNNVNPSKKYLKAKTYRFPKKHDKDKIKKYKSGEYIKAILNN